MRASAEVHVVDRSPRVAIGATILVVFLVGTAVPVIDADPTEAPQVAPSRGLGADPTPSPKTPPAAASPRATPRGKEIYKGHTIEEIAADPVLLDELLAEGDYISPGGVRIGEDGTVDPPVSDGSSDTVCPNHVECP
jgi:hypothetical protein